MLTAGANCSSWPCGFKFLFPCSGVYIYIVFILEDLYEGVHLQTI